MRGILKCGEFYPIFRMKGKWRKSSGSGGTVGCIFQNFSFIYNSFFLYKTLQIPPTPPTGKYIIGIKSYKYRLFHFFKFLVE